MGKNNVFSWESQSHWGPPSLSVTAELRVIVQILHIRVQKEEHDLKDSQTRSKASHAASARTHISLFHVSYLNSLAHFKCIVKPTSEIFDIPYYKRYPSYYELTLISDFKSVVSCSGTQQEGWVGSKRSYKGPSLMFSRYKAKFCFQPFLCPTQNPRLESKLIKTYKSPPRYLPSCFLECFAT